MDIKGTHQFSLQRSQIWTALLDPQVLADTIPGLRRLDVVEDGHYSVAVEVGVGAVKGVYAGTVRMEIVEPEAACVLTGTAKGTQGSVTGRAEMRLAEDGAGTTMDYAGDATITGPLAGVGQRMIGAVAKRMIKQFLLAIENEIVGHKTEAHHPEADVIDPVVSSAERNGEPIGRAITPRSKLSTAGAPGTGRELATPALVWAGFMTGVVVGLLLDRKR